MRFIGLQPLDKAVRDQSTLIGESLAPVEKGGWKIRSRRAHVQDSTQCPLPKMDDVDDTFCAIRKIWAGTVGSSARMEGLAKVQIRGFSEIGLVRNVGSFDVEGLTGRKPVLVRKNCRRNGCFPRRCADRPFLKIPSVGTSEARRRELRATVTEAIVKTLNIPPDIVTIYVHNLVNDLYARRSVLRNEDRCRIFIKDYVLSRDVESRRRLAEALNLAVSCVLEWRKKTSQSTLSKESKMRWRLPASCNPMTLQKMTGITWHDQYFDFT